MCLDSVKEFWSQDVIIDCRNFSSIEHTVNVVFIAFRLVLPVLPFWGSPTCSCIQPPPQKNGRERLSLGVGCVLLLVGYFAAFEQGDWICLVWLTSKGKLAQLLPELWNCNSHQSGEVGNFDPNRGSPISIFIPITVWKSAYYTALYLSLYLK